MRTACWPTSTTPTHSRPVCNECMTTATLHDVYVRPAARRPKRMPTSGSTRSGPSCCTASSREADGMKVDPGRVGRYSRAGWRWIRLLPPRRRRGLRVFYGHDRVPGPGEPVAGGSAKFQRLASRFPNDPTGFTVLYLGSTWLPRDLGPLLGLARRRSIPVVVNMDGVAYPGWAGERTEELNEPYRRALGAAAHVLYQSEFSKSSADEFLDAPPGNWEILHNAVDVNHFTPPAETPPDGPVLLLGGDQTQAYRLELGLRDVRPRPRVRALRAPARHRPPRLSGRAAHRRARPARPGRPRRSLLPARGA